MVERYKSIKGQDLSVGVTRAPRSASGFAGLEGFAQDLNNIAFDEYAEGKVRDAEAEAGSTLTRDANGKLGELSPMMRDPSKLSGQAYNSALKKVWMAEASQDANTALSNFARNNKFDATTYGAQAKAYIDQMVKGVPDEMKGSLRAYMGSTANEHTNKIADNVYNRNSSKRIEKFNSGLSVARDRMRDLSLGSAKTDNPREAASMMAKAYTEANLLDKQIDGLAVTDPENFPPEKVASLKKSIEGHLASSELQGAAGKVFEETQSAAKAQEAIDDWYENPDNPIVDLEMRKAVRDRAIGELGVDVSIATNKQEEFRKVEATEANKTLSEFDTVLAGGDYQKAAKMISGAYPKSQADETATVWGGTYRAMLSKFQTATKAANDKMKSYNNGAALIQERMDKDGANSYSWVGQDVTDVNAFIGEQYKDLKTIGQAGELNRILKGIKHLPKSVSKILEGSIELSQQNPERLKAAAALYRGMEPKLRSKLSPKVGAVYKLLLEADPELSGENPLHALEQAQSRVYDEQKTAIVDDKIAEFTGNDPSFFSKSFQDYASDVNDGRFLDLPGGSSIYPEFAPNKDGVKSPFMSFAFGGNPVVPEATVFKARRIFELRMQEAPGDAEQQWELSMEQALETTGVSDFTEGREWTHVDTPPNKAYGHLPGADEWGDWSKKQVVGIVVDNIKQGIFKQGFYGDDVTIKGVWETINHPARAIYEGNIWTRVVPGTQSEKVVQGVDGKWGGPQYFIMMKTSKGNNVPLEDADGNPIMYRPIPNNKKSVAEGLEWDAANSRAKDWMKSFPDYDKYNVSGHVLRSKLLEQGRTILERYTNSAPKKEGE